MAKPSNSGIDRFGERAGRVKKSIPWSEENGRLGLASILSLVVATVVASAETFRA